MPAYRWPKDSLPDPSPGGGTRQGQESGRSVDMRLSAAFDLATVFS